MKTAAIKSVSKKKFQSFIWLAVVGRKQETGGTGLINCVEASKIGLVRDTGVIDW